MFRAKLQRALYVLAWVVAAARGEAPLSSSDLSCEAGSGGAAPELPPLPTWTTLEEATKADYDAMGVEYSAHVDAKLPETLIAMLRAQAGAKLGQPVDLLEHGLQTATRAERGGESDEVCY